MMNKQVPQLPFEPKLLKWSLFQNRLCRFLAKKQVECNLIARVYTRRQFITQLISSATALLGGYLTKLASYPCLLILEFCEV